MADNPDPTMLDLARDFLAHPSTPAALGVIGAAVSGVVGWLGATFSARRAAHQARRALEDRLDQLEDAHAAKAASDSASHQAMADEVRGLRERQVSALARLEVLERGQRGVTERLDSILAHLALR